MDTVKSRRTRDDSIIIWRKPREGNLKLNTNAAVLRGEHDFIGLGVVIRSNGGGDKFQRQNGPLVWFEFCIPQYK